MKSIKGTITEYPTGPKKPVWEAKYRVEYVYHKGLWKLKKKHIIGESKSTTHD